MPATARAPKPAPDLRIAAAYIRVSTDDQAESSPGVGTPEAALDRRECK